MIPSAVQRTGFKVVIVDESHYLKNAASQRSQLLAPCMAAARRIVLLSGTPALARPRELYPQVNAIEPHLLGTAMAFEKKFCDGHKVRPRAAAFPAAAPPATAPPSPPPLHPTRATSAGTLRAART